MKARPYFFSGPYFPKPEDNRMESVGDTVILRRDFLEHKPAKLDHLFKLRFGWMNEHLNAGERGLEIGCGAAFTQLYLRTDVKIWHSDVFYQDWLSTVLDGLTLPFANQSLDFIIAVDAIHHLANPALFFDEVSRVLKPRGKLIIKEPHASLSFRCVLRLMHHEGYAYDVDPCGREKPCNDPTDPWSGNNAIADLLWEARDELKQNWGLSTVHYTMMESLMLYLSGGVSAKSFSLPLKPWMLRILQKLDHALSQTFPSLFPTGVQWVMQKN